MYEPVDIPSDKKIKYKSVNNKVYVYVVEGSKRIKGKKNPRPIEKIIGRYLKEENKLIPNSNYFMIFNKSLHIRIDDCIHFGANYVFKFIADRLNLTKYLQEVFPLNYREILAISNYMLTQGNVMSYIENWCSEEYTCGNVAVTSQTSSTIFESITNTSKLKFFEKWAEDKLENDYTAYDITSVSSYSKNIDYIEYGYNRDKENLPQLNIGLYYTENTRLPIYYNVYSGSINDKTELPVMLRNTELLNIKKLMCVMDNGFFKTTNITSRYENIELDYIIAVSKSLKEAKKILDKYPGNIMINSNNRISYGDLFAAKESEAFNGKLNLYVYYNQNKATVENDNLFNKVKRLENELKSLKKVPKNIKRYDKYIEIKRNDDNTFAYIRRHDVINNEMKYNGYTIIACTKDLDAETVLEKYRTKDVVEKAFCDLKNVLEMDRLLTQNTETTDGKIFISFIGLIIRSEFMNIISTYIKARNKTFKDIILTLNKIKLFIKDNKFYNMSALTKEQKDILKCFGISEKNVNEYIELLNV